MIKVIVASKNPVKINAVRIAFKKMFPKKPFWVEGLSIPSGVKEQPLSDAETFNGAVHRVNAASKEIPMADYWVGIEGGVAEKKGEMEAFAWVIIKSKEGLMGKGRTATFFLPPKVCQLIKQGKELGEADDLVFRRINSKQKNGAVGILTGDIITRTSYYTTTVVLALMPFRNPKLYKKQ